MSFSTLCIQRHQHSHMRHCYYSGLNTRQVPSSQIKSDPSQVPSTGDRTVPNFKCTTDIKPTHSLTALSLLVYYFSLSLIFSCDVNQRYTSWIPVRSDCASNIRYWAVSDTIIRCLPWWRHLVGDCKVKSHTLVPLFGSLPH